MAIMQRVTYRYLTFAALQALKQTFTDAEMTEEMMIFWVKSAVNRVKAKRLGKTGIVSGSYLSIFTDVPVHFQYGSANNILPKEKYITLPANILDLDLDAAVNWVAYQCLGDDGCWKKQLFERTTLTQVKLMYDSYFEKPRPTNPYYVRVNEELYLFGVKDVPITTVEVGLYTSENPKIGDMNWDDEVLLNDEEILDVVNTVLGIGRFVMLIPKERIQDAADTRSNPSYKQYSTGQDVSAVPQDQQQQPE